MSSIYTYFLSITPGLEDLLADEVSTLIGGKAPRIRQGGIEVSGPIETMWTLCRTCRLAEGLRLRIARFQATHFDALKIGLGKQPWAAYLPRGATPVVAVQTQKSALYHKRAVAERAEEVIWTRLKTDTPNKGLIDVPKVHLRINKNWVDVSIEAVGERLHRRGYREHIGKAPMRETLASACIAASGLDLNKGLWDPFCGSGTLVLEAALAHNGMIATERRFAFQDWPIHKEEEYQVFVAKQGAASPSVLKGQFWGSDHDPREIRAAMHNLRLSAMSDVAKLTVADFDEVANTLPSGVGILSNLPYGHRTDPRQLQDTYRRFAKMLNRRRDIRNVVVLSGDLDFPRATRLRWKALLRFKNRGLPVHLLALES